MMMLNWNWNWPKLKDQKRARRRMDIIHWNRCVFQPRAWQKRTTSQQPSTTKTTRKNRRNKFSNNHSVVKVFFIFIQLRNEFLLNGFRSCLIIFKNFRLWYFEVHWSSLGDGLLTLSRPLLRTIQDVSLALFHIFTFSISLCFILFVWEKEGKLPDRIYLKSTCKVHAAAFKFHVVCIHSSWRHDHIITLNGIHVENILSCEP